MKIAILGFGTVGRGVDQICATIEDVEVARILDVPDRCEGPRMTSDFSTIVDDASIEVVLECMGGLEPAHEFILRCLRAGKSVVTSNKAVIAAYLDEFARVADEHGTCLFVEASCGGGIPWISNIEKARRIDPISRFSGIMNGTTNYIVDAMRKNGADFGETLASAQELGYAEADPTADIDGIDVRNKTIIGVDVAFDTSCKRDIPTTGIRTLTKADLDLFARHGRTVKLLGRAVSEDGRYAAAVEPVAVTLSSLEAQVPGNFNLVTLEGATVGQLSFYGQGAGSLPTGNAMVQDVLDYAEGRRPRYDLTRELGFDPSLLAGDYVFRTTMAAPQAAEPYDEGAWVMHDVDPVQARALLDEALSLDPTSLMAALPQED